MAPSRPLERPWWRGFVPRRRELVLCSAMGKNLAGTLMSGERPGEKMGPIVLSRWWGRGGYGTLLTEEKEGRRWGQDETDRGGRRNGRGGGGERRKRRRERDADRKRQGTGEGEGRCSKVVKRKKESGSERERREEKKWGEWKRGGGESCVERGADKGGGRKQEESYNAAVVSVSCVPRAGSPDWSVRAPGLRLHLGLSSWKETGLYRRILLW